MGMEQLALGWLVLEMTDSAFMVGVSSAARMAPFFFLGILSGAIADRIDRGLFLKFVTVGVGAMSALMAVVLLTGMVEPVNPAALEEASGSGNAWQVAIVIGIATASGCAWAFMMTLKQSYTYDIVGAQHSLNGLSLNSMSQRFGGILGALMSGWLIVQSDIGVQYIIVTSTFVLALVLLLPIRGVGQAAPKERESVGRNLIGYFQVLRDNPTLRMLMLLTSITEIFGFTHQSLLPVFARDVIGVDAAGLGYMRAVQQGGGVIGLLALTSMGSFRRKGLLMFLIAAGFGFGQMGLYVFSSLLAFILLLAFINACAMSVDTLYKVLMQENVTNEQRGRAMGSWVLSIGTAPVGHLNVGWIAGAIGAPGALLVNGSVLAFVSLAGLLGFPKMRRLP